MTREDKIEKAVKRAIKKVLEGKLETKFNNELFCMDEYINKGIDYC